ncbi:MAG: peptide ABC transporter substrate-binding protein [Phycisphaerae bacterium]|nr:peptide ABC transporter substrate-binding protein [Phycisphaerae bacterium]MDW8262764.1 peptide ABC transporter substrate-binding protein [Phycisphaerales bacterium]
MSIPIALIALVLLTLLWSSGGRPPRRADFTFINRGDIITLDLNQMSYQQDFRLTHGIREGLYEYHWETLKATRAGAEREDCSPDGRIWTFHLRREARWSNGDPVTAGDYVFSWRRMLEEPGEYTYLFYYIRNAKAYEDSYAKGEPIDFAEVGIAAVDDYTFRVTVNDPVPFMLDLMAFPPFYPRHERSMAPFREFVDRSLMDRVAGFARARGLDLSRMTYPEVLEQIDGFAASRPSLSEDDQQKLQRILRTRAARYTFRNEYTRPPHVVTNGPFNLTEWQFKRRLWLEKSPTYWNRDAVKSNTIEMVVNENVLSQFLQYEAGTVDWLADIPTDLASDLRARGRTDLRTSKAFGTAFITFMCRENLPRDIAAGGRNPLSDVRVRQALAMAIDKRFITENITRMGEEVATTYFPPGTLPDFEVLPGLPFDVARARNLLSEAGYPNGKGFPTLPILFNSENPIRSRIAQVLKEQWKKHLGIETEIQSLEVKMYRNKVTEKNYAIALVAWYGDYPDVSTFTDKYLSTSLQNDADWRNPTYDELCQQAAKEPDPARRLKLLQQAEHLIDTEVPIVPLYHYVNCWMFRDNVRGLKPNARNQTDFKVIEVVN